MLLLHIFEMYLMIHDTLPRHMKIIVAEHHSALCCSMRTRLSVTSHVYRGYLSQAEIEK